LNEVASSSAGEVGREKNLVVEKYQLAVLEVAALDIFLYFYPLMDVEMVGISFSFFQGVMVS
jgi:hypothetical protein